MPLALFEITTNPEPNPRFWLQKQRTLKEEGGERTERGEAGTVPHNYGAEKTTAVGLNLDDPMRSLVSSQCEKRMVHINCPCYRGLTASLEEKAKNGEGPKVAGGARIRDYDSVRDGLSLSQSLFRERQGGIRGRKDSR
ncbi:hypothetical protein BHM03_00007284 [Ensete ventricosum]|nr:hypothetical protein BHM03_00007284 [Ensete ventricosum]